MTTEMRKAPTRQGRRPAPHDAVTSGDVAEDSRSVSAVASIDAARRRRALRDALDWLDHHDLCACWTAMPGRQCARPGWRAR